MPTCKHCGKDYHYCSSCGWDETSESGFCSETCRELHALGDNTYRMIMEFAATIPNPKLFRLLFFDEKIDDVPHGKEMLDDLLELREKGHVVFCKEKLDSYLKWQEEKRKRDEEREARKKYYKMIPITKEEHEELRKAGEKVREHDPSGNPLNWTA